jgi:predicted nucleic acid-binding Zn ribbon protein
VFYFACWAEYFPLTLKQENERDRKVLLPMNFPPRRIPPLGGPKPTARQRALSEWRGVDLAPVEARQALRSQSIADVMPKVLNKLGLDRRRAEAEIVRVWNHLLDPNVTAHAQPTGLNKGTLFVTVDSNVWLSEIVRYRRKEILDRLQHSFGHDLIARISFRAG